MKKRPGVIVIRILLCLLAAGLLVMFALPAAGLLFRRLRMALLPAALRPVIAGGLAGRSAGDLPVFDGMPAVELDGGKPRFSAEECAGAPGDRYAPLDDLGRCGEAFAVITRDMMPAAPRGEIGQIRPSGWHTVKYPDLIEDRYLYNRCHLIAYALTGQNDNERNLVTGTRFLNVEGMLPYELEVIRFLSDAAPGERVLYRVTPVFAGDELVCRGVEMEAYTPDDNGAGVCFHVYVFNVQPGIVIDYATGESRREE